MLNPARTDVYFFFLWAVSSQCESRRFWEVHAPSVRLTSHAIPSVATRSLASMLLRPNSVSMVSKSNLLRLRNARETKGLSTSPLPTAMSSDAPHGLRAHRKIAFRTEILLQRRWLDVTADVATSLPPLPFAIATISGLSEDSCCSLALVDPKLLEVGPLEAVVPERHAAVSLGVRNGGLLLPAGARLLLLMEKDGELGLHENDSISIDICIEATESLLTAPNGPVGSEAIAQAALRTALLASGVNSTVLADLESSPEQIPANRVYETFVTQGHRPEELLHAARRAAHHINHLLRHEATKAAEYVRNNDKARNGSGTLSSAAPPHPLYLVLDNVRSAFNVGSIFRTADTARCGEVITCGFTPHPPNPKLAKTAFGAIQEVPTHHEESTLHAVRSLQARGIKVYAMETTEISKTYANISFSTDGIALVLGNEETGVDTRVLSLVDGVVEIPTFGSKNSLNVASAASIVVFEVLRQWGKLN